MSTDEKPGAESVTAIAARVQSGELTAEKATEDALGRIAALDGEVNAFLRVARDEALAQARAVDQKRARGEPLGKLCGVPIAIKDAICTRGIESTSGSKSSPATSRPTTRRSSRGSGQPMP